MRALIRSASTLARAAEAAPLASASTSQASSLPPTTGTQGRSRNQASRPPKPSASEDYRAPKPRKTHKRWNYTRMFQKVPIRLGPVSEPRTLAHYNNTLADDLLYLTYNHNAQYSPPKLPQHDQSNPYTINRAPLKMRGNRGLRPTAPPTTHEHVIKLEKIILHTMCKEAASNRSAIISALTAFRQISGETQAGGGRDTNQGVQLVRTKRASAAFKVGNGIPIGCKVELKGEKMYEFINSLAEFVLPRMRDFSGIVMPPPSANPNSASATGGVVAFGLPPTAMALFPQVEVNFDSYPRSHGFHIDFVTSARGKNAQNKARALVSGFRIPFVRK